MATVGDGNGGGQGQGENPAPVEGVAPAGNAGEGIVGGGGEAANAAAARNAPGVAAGAAVGATPATTDKILELIGIRVQAHRDAVKADLMPTSLIEISQLSTDDIKEACAAYPKLAENSFAIPRVTMNRLISLKMWVRDQIRAGILPQVPDMATEQTIRAVIQEAALRATRRKDLKKTGENLVTSKFNNALKSQAQWEKWNEELNATLAGIIGVRGIPLSYVIRRNEPPIYNKHGVYEKDVILSTPLNGPEFITDASTVHQIILHNVHEDSDAYTYLKNKLRHQNGRTDIKALRERYESDATMAARRNQAKKTLKTLMYRSERGFPFERFIAKLQYAYDELEDCGRKVDNGDIVDDLWDRIQSSHLTSYISALKVQYQMQPRDYRLILQDIAAQIPNEPQGSRFAGRNASGLEVAATYTRQGKCPANGIHLSDGRVFIGTYPKHRWASDDVKPHWQEIHKARENDQEGGNSGGPTHSRSQKRQASAVKRKKRQLKKLKQEVASYKSKLAAIKREEENDTADEGNSEGEDNAGDAFGGKRSKKEAKKPKR